MALLAFAAFAVLPGCDSSSDDVKTVARAQYLYVANADGTVSAYSISASKGSLAELDGSPFDSAPGAFKLAADPSGKFLYVLSGTTAEVYGHEIDPLTGELSDLADSPFAVAATPKDLDIDPAGDYLYIGHGDAPGYISGYEIGGKSGDLTEVPGSPLETGGNGIRALAIYTGGRYLYAADLSLASTVYGYAIDEDTGGLSRLLNSPFTEGTQPNDIAPEPTGRFLFMSDDDAIDSLFVQSASGEIAAADDEDLEVDSPVSLIAGPTGEYLYAAGAGDLHGMTIRGDGTLENLVTQTGGTDLRGIALDASGVFLYATDFVRGEVLGFSLEDSGNVPTELFTSPFSASVSPSGIVMVQVEVEE